MLPLVSLTGELATYLDLELDRRWTENYLTTLKSQQVARVKAWELIVGAFFDITVKRKCKTRNIPQATSSSMLPSTTKRS